MNRRRRATVVLLVNFEHAGRRAVRFAGVRAYREWLRSIPEGPFVAACGDRPHAFAGRDEFLGAVDVAVLDLREAALICRKLGLADIGDFPEVPGAADAEGRVACDSCGDDFPPALMHGLVCVDCRNGVPA